MTGVDMSQEDGFRTKRLCIRNWSLPLSDRVRRQELIEQVASILTPAVLRHLPEPLQISNMPGAAEEWIAARASESDVMTIRRRSIDDLLGLLILAEFPEADAKTTVHLGYLFSEEAWGNGYATELVSGLVGWYDSRGRSVRFLGGVETQNTASASVLKKNGFKRDELLSSGSTDMYCLLT